MQVFPVSLFSCKGDPPPENFENQECRRSHLRPFCNAITDIRLSEFIYLFSLFIDDSEKKVTNNFMLLNVFELNTGVYRQQNASACEHVTIFFLRKSMAKVGLEILKQSRVQGRISNAKLSHSYL